jgi:hypothetical protein
MGRYALHDDVRGVILFKIVEHRDDVRVQAATGGPHLRRKSLERLGIIGKIGNDVRLERLDRDRAIYLLVVGFIDNAYGSTPHDVFDPVLANAIGVRFQPTHTSQRDWLFRRHVHALAPLLILASHRNHDSSIFIALARLRRILLKDLDSEPTSSVLAYSYCATDSSPILTLSAVIAIFLTGKMTNL